MVHFANYSSESSSLTDREGNYDADLHSARHDVHMNPPLRTPSRLSVDVPAVVADFPQPVDAQESKMAPFFLSSISHIQTCGTLHTLMTKLKGNDDLAIPEEILHRIASLGSSLRRLREVFTMQLDANSSAQQANNRDPELCLENGDTNGEALITVLEVLNETEEIGVEGWRWWIEEQMSHERVMAWVEEQDPEAAKLGSKMDCEDAAGLPPSIGVEHGDANGDEDERATTVDLRGYGTGELLDPVNVKGNSEYEQFEGHDDYFEPLPVPYDTSWTIEDYERGLLKYEQEVLKREKRVLEHEQQVLEHERRGQAFSDHYSHYATTTDQSSPIVNGNDERMSIAYLLTQQDKHGSSAVSVAGSTPDAVNIPSLSVNTPHQGSGGGAFSISKWPQDANVKTDDHHLFTHPNNPNGKLDIDTASRGDFLEETKLTRLPPFEFYVQGRENTCDEILEHVLFPLPAGFKIPAHSPDVVGMEFPTAACVVHFYTHADIRELQEALDWHQAVGHRALTIGLETSTIVIEAHTTRLLEERVQYALACAMEQGVWGPPSTLGNLSHFWGAEELSATYIVSNPDLKFIRPTGEHATDIDTVIEVFDIPHDFGERYSSKEHYLRGGLLGNGELDKECSVHSDFVHLAAECRFKGPIPSFQDRFFAFSGHVNGYVESPYLSSSDGSRTFQANDDLFYHKDDGFRTQTLHHMSCDIAGRAAPANFNYLSDRHSKDAIDDAVLAPADFDKSCLERAKDSAEQFQALRGKYNQKKEENVTLQRKLAGQASILNSVNNKNKKAEEKALHFENSILGLVRVILTSFDQFKELGVADQIHELFQRLQGGRQQAPVISQLPRQLQQQVPTPATDITNTQVRQPIVGIRGGKRRSTTLHAVDGTDERSNRRSEPGPVVGFIWDMSRSIVLLNSHQYYTFNPDTTLQHVQHLLHFRRVNNKEDNHILRRVSDVLEMRDEDGLPLPDTLNNAVLLITVPRRYGGLATDEGGLNGEFPEWDEDWLQRSPDHGNKTELYETFNMLWEEANHHPGEHRRSSYIPDEEGAIEDFPSPGNSICVPKGYSGIAKLEPEPEAYLQVKLEQPEINYVTVEQTRLQERLKASWYNTSASNAGRERFSSTSSDSDSIVYTPQRRHKDLGQALGAPYFQAESAWEPLVDPGVIPLPYNLLTFWDDEIDQKHSAPSHRAPILQAPKKLFSLLRDSHPTPPPSPPQKDDKFRGGVARRNVEARVAGNMNSSFTISGDATLPKRSRTTVTYRPLRDEAQGQKQTASLRPGEVDAEKFSERNALTYLATPSFFGVCSDPTQTGSYAYPSTLGPSTRKLQKSASVLERNRRDKSTGKTRRWSSGGSPCCGLFDRRPLNEPPSPPKKPSTKQFKTLPRKDDDPMGRMGGVQPFFGNYGGRDTPENTLRYADVWNTGYDAKEQARTEGQPNKIGTLRDHYLTRNGVSALDYITSRAPSRTSNRRETNNDQLATPSPIIMSEKKRGKLPKRDTSQDEPDFTSAIGDWDGSMGRFAGSAVIEPVEQSRNGIQIRM